MHLNNGRLLTQLWWVKNKSQFAYLGFRFVKHPSTTTTKRIGNFLCEFKRGDQIILGVVFNREPCPPAKCVRDTRVWECGWMGLNVNESRSPSPKAHGLGSQSSRTLWMIPDEWMYWVERKRERERGKETKSVKIRMWTSLLLLLLLKSLRHLLFLRPALS